MKRKLFTSTVLMAVMFLILVALSYADEPNIKNFISLTLQRHF
jgi:hypothetical protein